VLAYALPEAGFVLEEKPPGPSGADSRLHAKLVHAHLTLTALDTESLRLWMAAPSTREKRYALLTVPDFGQPRSLIDKPVVAFASGFGRTANEGLRTDSFSGQVIQPLAVVDLSRAPEVETR
jgi:hypothetical protein